MQLRLQFDQNIGIYTFKKEKNLALKHIKTLTVTVCYMQTQGLIDGIAIK